MVLTANRNDPPASAPRERTRTGKRATQMLMKAQILLAADVDGPGLSDRHIVERLCTSRSSVERVRRRLNEAGLDAELARKKQECPSREPARSKNAFKLHLRRQWVIPPDANAAFVATMEDVLEVYQRPHDPCRPLVCSDETSKQLIRETR